MENGIKHFLDLNRVDARDLRLILDAAAELKQGEAPFGDKPMRGRTLAMIFEKPSTRTRVSFEVAMKQLGGDVVVLQGAECQLGRGETIEDTARVLSRYVDSIMIRTDDPNKLQAMADAASVPIINGLTDNGHPCQVMADILTLEEKRGSTLGKTVAWVGDGNNMANSWIHAAGAFDLTLRLACPEGYEPDAAAIDWARAEGARVEVLRDPADAVAGAECVVTDTWVSMGDSGSEQKMADLAGYQVTEALMARAAPDALFLHCLPAHRGEEVTAAVIDGPQSVVWDEAENRLHAQKAILGWAVP